MKNTTTTTRNKNSLANLASGNVIKTAWAIRKATAATHGVRVMLISWKSCLHAAMGKGKRIVDVAGYTVGSKQSQLTSYIFDSETPVVLRAHDMEGVAGANQYRINSWLRDMAVKGYVQMAQAGQYVTTAKGCPSYQTAQGVTYTVVDQKRPYSNMVAA
jgi:hypothetical protein